MNPHVARNGVTETCLIYSAAMVLILLSSMDVHADSAQVERAILASPVLNVRFGGWSVTPTLVPHVFALQPPSGSFAPSFYHEIKGYIGSMRGWQEVTPTGLQPLGPQLASALRREIVASLDWDLGIKQEYGAAKHAALFFSAYDCPNCRRFEQRLAREGVGLNALLYLFPQTLHANDEQRAVQVAKVWCASQPRSAWNHLVKEQVVSGRLAANCQRSNRKSTELSDMLGVRGVPALVTRQGTVLYGFIDKPWSDLARALDR